MRCGKFPCLKPVVLGFTALVMTLEIAVLITKNYAKKKKWFWKEAKTGNARISKSSQLGFM